MVLSAEQRDRLEVATQALLHWSCRTTDRSLLLTIGWLVDRYRQHSDGAWASERLSYEDWHQRMRIGYRHMSVHADTAVDDAWDVSNVVSPLIEPFAESRWWSNPSRAAVFESLQRDAVDWLFSLSIPLPDKLDILPSLVQRRNDQRTAATIKRAMDAVVSAINRPDGEQHRPRDAFSLTVQMARLAIHVGNASLTRCLLHVLKTQLIEDLRENDRPFLIFDERFQYQLIYTSAIADFGRSKIIRTPTTHSDCRQSIFD